MPLLIQRTTPIFRIFDVAKAREFYVDFLGFVVDWEHRFEGVSPIYLQISLAGCTLHLSEHHGDCCPGSTAFLTVKQLREYHAGLIAKQYGFLRPGLEETFHNSLCMEVVDPFGNRLRFDEPHETKDH
jgi:ribosomal-protein-alanine N-acetyltransferase